VLALGFLAGMRNPFIPPSDELSEFWKFRNMLAVALRNEDEELDELH